MIENPFGIRSLARGYQLNDPVVQFDTGNGRGPSIISHAHSDHTTESKRTTVLATPATADLLRTRGHLGKITRVPYDEWRDFDGWRMKLLPAGHILGSAQILIERSDGLRLLYTGDMKTRPGRTAEPARFEPVDDLIIESTFGLPIFRFPPEEETAARMVDFARACLGNGLLPVFLGYALGKGQEIMSILAEGNVPTLVHSSTWAITQVYQRHGYSFGDAERLSASLMRARRAWVIPPHLSALLTEDNPAARICYASGWALLESRRQGGRIDLMAPLSDHADYYDLMEAIAMTSPQRVWAVHGPHADLFAADVARRFGVQAAALDTITVNEETI